MPTERLADEALDPVALDGAARMAACDGEPQAGTIRRARKDDEQEERVGESPAAGEHGLVGRLRQEPGVAGKAAA